MLCFPILCGKNIFAPENGEGGRREGGADAPLAPP